MKKLISILVLMVMMFTVTGCYSSYDYEEEEAYVKQETESKPQSNSQSKPQVEVEKEPEEVKLTTENIRDYLMFSLNAKDIEIGEWEHDRFQQLGEGILSVKVSPKKRGDFSGVVLNVTLTSDSEGWVAGGDWAERKKEMVISLDGEFEEEYKINSIVSDNVIHPQPKFDLIINSVTGTFTEN